VNRRPRLDLGPGDLRILYFAAALSTLGGRKLEIIIVDDAAPPPPFSLREVFAGVTSSFFSALCTVEYLISRNHRLIACVVSNETSRRAACSLVVGLLRGAAALEKLTEAATLCRRWMSVRSPGTARVLVCAPVDRNICWKRRSTTNPTRQAGLQSCSSH